MIFFDLKLSVTSLSTEESQALTISLLELLWIYNDFVHIIKMLKHAKRNECRQKVTKVQFLSKVL